MSHYLGALFKYLAAAAVFCFSVSLSYTFFSAIQPANMPWFVWAAMSLTEIGLLCWLAVFMLQHHHSAHKTIAFVMVFVCLIAVLFTDAVELARLFGSAFFLAQFYYYALIVLLLAHFIAFVMDFFVSYFAKNSFHHDGKISYEQGNLNPMNGGYSSRPLALRNQPKDAPMGAVSLGQVATAQIPAQTTAHEQREEAEEIVTLSQVATAAKDKVKEVASTAMKRVSRSKKRTKKAPVRVHGKVNAITEESTSPNNEEASEKLSAEQREAIREEAKTRFRHMKEASEEEA